MNPHPQTASGYFCYYQIETMLNVSHKQIRILSLIVLR